MRKKSWRRKQIPDLVGQAWLHSKAASLGYFCSLLKRPKTSPRSSKTSQKISSSKNPKKYRKYWLDFSTTAPSPATDWNKLPPTTKPSFCIGTAKAAKNWHKDSWECSGNCTAKTQQLLMNWSKKCCRCSSLKENASFRQDFSHFYYDAFPKSSPPFWNDASLLNKTKNWDQPRRECSINWKHSCWAGRQWRCRKTRRNSDTEIYLSHRYT